MNVGVQNVKIAVRNISQRLLGSNSKSPSAITTPRTMYTSLPTNDFDNFLNDDHSYQDGGSSNQGPSSGIYQSPTRVLPQE